MVCVAGQFYIMSSGLANHVGIVLSAEDSLSLMHSRHTENADIGAFVAMILLAAMCETNQSFNRVRTTSIHCTFIRFRFILFVSEFAWALLRSYRRVLVSLIHSPSDKNSAVGYPYKNGTMDFLSSKILSFISVLDGLGASEWNLRSVATSVSCYWSEAGESDDVEN
jgi:hypothetical protein